MPCAHSPNKLPVTILSRCEENSCFSSSSSLFLSSQVFLDGQGSQSVTESDSVSLEKGRALILMHFPVTKQSFNHYSLFALFYLCSLFPLDTSPLSLVYQFYDCFFATLLIRNKHRIPPFLKVHKVSSGFIETR